MREQGPPTDTSGPSEDDVLVVPDALPAEPRPGLRARLRGRWRAAGERRLERWRLGRRTAAAEAGAAWDPHERPPARIAFLLAGSDRLRVATERLRALRDLHPEVELLHRRRVPPLRSAADHVLVGPGGVVVAASPRWPAGVLINRGRLIVGGRDRTREVDVVVRQVAAVRDTLKAQGYAGVPVHGVMHCLETEDLALDGSLAVGKVLLLDAMGTLGRAAGDDLLTYEGIRQLVVVLERKLPPAVA